MAKANSISRRNFFKASGVAVATIGLAAGCTNSAEDALSESPAIISEDEVIDVIDSYENVEPELVEDDVFELPLGSLLHEAEGNWIPVMSVGKSARPVNYCSTLSLATGDLYTVLAEPITQEANMVVFDVRCSDEVYAWVELNTVTRGWVLYAQAFTDGALNGSPTALWKEDHNWDPPSFAITGKSVLWQVRPALTGEKTRENSYCYLWNLGAQEATAAVESQGRFACAMSVSDGVVTLAPRVLSDTGVFYGVNAYSLSDQMESVIDQLVFPQSVRPFQIARVGGRIVASVEANYDSGGALGGMGTYVKMETGDFVRLQREPLAGISGRGDTIIIKNRASYTVFDVAKKTYSVLLASDRCVDYGEYPARSGECDSFVTFATIKEAGEGYPHHVLVRRFTF